MRFKTKKLALMLLVGCFIAISLRTTDHDVAIAQGRKAVVITRIFTGPDGLAHADVENVERGRAAIGGRPTAVVALGSGTVCDVAKHACFMAEREDGARTVLVLVPTAASVTARMCATGSKTLQPRSSISTPATTRASCW